MAGQIRERQKAAAKKAQRAKEDKDIKMWRRREVEQYIERTRQARMREEGVQERAPTEAGAQEEGQA
jgi:hypothetical protein